MKKIKLGVVGATGLVGQTLLRVLKEQKIEFDELRLFASTKSVGKVIHFLNSDYIIHSLDEECFCGLDYVIFATCAVVSKKWVPIALKHNVTVIDNSSCFRMNDKAFLLVPEVNMEGIKITKGSLICNPNCSTIQCMLPLSCLKRYGIKRIVYNTYQSVSGAGNVGINDLLRCRAGKMPIHFDMDISCTCIPQIDEISVDNYTLEEYKMVNETRKILNLNDIAISATCIRVPVMFGHGVSVLVELSKKFDIESIKNEFKQCPSIVICDDILPSSILATKTDKVYVGRIRKDLSSPNGLLFYCVADNLRRGAASNAVLILKKILYNSNGE